MNFCVFYVLFHEGFSELIALTTSVFFCSPGASYDFLEEPGGTQTEFAVLLKVCNMSFTGRGQSKKIAKFCAAEAAMQELFGFSFDENYSKLLV